MKNILLVDDDIGFCDSLIPLIDSEGYRVDTLYDSCGAIDFIRDKNPDVVLLDVNLPSRSGLDLLKEIGEIDNAPPVIMISGHVNTENAIEAMREGAYEYVAKPFEIEQLISTIGKAIDSSVGKRNRLIDKSKTLVVDNTATEKTIHDPRNGEVEIIGKSDEIVEIAKLIGQVAKSNAAVLIFGESGTGKELIAKAIHRNSNRSDKVFLSVNCAALTESLLESELFGHEKGAFTNAYSRRLGKFELADEGTLFLDEIADMSPGTQSKFLRVLQEQEFERVGGEEKLKVNVRVIAATNRSLVSRIKESKFRVDLFYRLKVVSIYLPPLRERNQDIPLLAEHFLKKYNKITGKQVQGFDKAAIQLLSQYSWPGNVRELENNIHTAVVMCRDSEMRADDLPMAKENREVVRIDFEELKDNYYKMFKGVLDQSFTKIYTNSNGQIYHHIQEAVEKVLIGMTLKHLNNNQVQVAQALGISRNTLRDRIDRFNL